MHRALIALSLGLLFAALACQSAAPSPPTSIPPPPSAPPPFDVPMASPEVKVPGTFIFARDGNVWSMAHRGRPKRLTSFPSTHFPAYPAVSPDGRQVAFSLFMPSQSANDPGGTDLYLMDRDGGNVRVFLSHDLPGSTLEAPAWSPDGKTILFTYRVQHYENNRFLGEELRLERTTLAAGSRTTVMAKASHASFFPDGKRLVYVVTDLKTYAQSLWVANADGTEARQIVKQGHFSALFAPRPSPGGRSIVFGATGETPSAARGGASGRRPAWLPAWLTTGFGTRVAEAHGVPWDLWLVQSDGADLRRLTYIMEDAPFPVWLPGGQQIAFLGERALYLVDREGKQVVRLADEFGGIGLSWLPEEPR